MAAPLLFGMKLFDLESVMQIIYGFILFCIAASSIYIINDIFDIKTDRLHPKNKNRPLASGRISIKTAIILFLILWLMLIVAVLYFINMRIISFDFFYILFLYLAINLGYSLGLKHVSLVEMFLVAFGYILRVIAGCILISVTPSPWIIIVTGVVSMLIIAVKRRSELVTCSFDTGLRKSISEYNIAFIDSMISIFGTATIITYMLYTIAPTISNLHHANQLVYTSLFVTYGVTRYILLIKVKKDTHSPTDLVTSDAGICLSVLFWVASLIYVFYF
ncbi:MAG: UbiA prenyltransferase family protein [Gammaproteobacteria bacterium]|nr:UbiA prenyltransferase family protein [Gammaproteobacteria bacterium]